MKLIVKSTTNCFGSHVYPRSFGCLLLLLLGKVVRYSGTVFCLLSTLFNSFYLFIRNEFILASLKGSPTSISCLSKGHKSPYFAIVLFHDCTRLVHIHFLWLNLEYKAGI